MSVIFLKTFCPNRLATFVLRQTCEGGQSPISFNGVSIHARQDGAILSKISPTEHASDADDPCSR
jgi:hypothetical protein